MVPLVESITCLLRHRRLQAKPTSINTLVTRSVSFKYYPLFSTPVLWFMPTLVFRPSSFPVRIQTPQPSQLYLTITTTRPLVSAQPPTSPTILPLADPTRSRDNPTFALGSTTADVSSIPAASRNAFSFSMDTRAVAAPASRPSQVVDSSRIV